MYSFVAAADIYWVNVINVTISLSLPPGEMGVYVVPVWGLLLDDSNAYDVEDDLNDWLGTYNKVLDGVLLVHGSNLLGTFTWTRRDVIGKVGWNIHSLPTMSTYTPKFNGLQPFAEGQTPDPNTATLTLIQLSSNATEYFRDTADSTVINGMSTFGGFWSFVNDTFTLIFGANVLYFAFGRRPLSALGFVHLFQRKELRQQWNEDFPTICTEGGHPGDKSAGIVAFIRERLVDLSQVDEDHPDDVEAQRLSGAHDTEEISTESIPATTSEYSRMRESGDALDGIPLLDVDLGSVTPTKRLCDNACQASPSRVSSGLSDELEHDEYERGREDGRLHVSKLTPKFPAKKVEVSNRGKS
ncbi:hypothetical protein C8R46DRAFT_1048432 [Mycena filopes]|nr:hypothetical protein C8R46DRAFT_1048432 [Mycena filopes]